ncbi:MAG: hypothetical protein ACREDZ_08535 [Kiloniellales bacterium]
MSRGPNTAISPQVTLIDELSLVGPAKYQPGVAAPGNAPDAKYTVHHDGGSTVVAVDHRRQSGEWVKLGSFAFEAGTTGSSSRTRRHALIPRPAASEQAIRNERGINRRRKTPAKPAATSRRTSVTV